MKPKTKAPAKKAAPAKKPAKAPAKKAAVTKPVTKPDPEPRRHVDKEAVERDYRLGKFTLRELGAKHGCDHALIARWVKRYGWTQDLSKAVKAATNAKLIQQAVSNEVTKGQQAVTNTVLAAAELNAQVVLRHRARVEKAVSVAERMLDELDSTTTKSDELDAMFERITEDMDEKALQSARQQFREFMRLHARVGSAQKLMLAIKDAQNLERQAYGLDDDHKPGDDFADLSDEELDAKIEELQRAHARRAEPQG